MRIQFRSILAVVAMAAVIGWCPPSRADTDIRELPTTPETQSAPGTDYALRPVTFAGSTVTLIDVHSGVGDWTRPDVAKLPALPSASGLPAKEAVQWFYGSIAGWMAVPAGWRVQRATIGVDANARYTFVAADGAASGWVTYAVIPACEECLLRDAEGVLPGAGEALASRHDAVPIHLGQTNPVMSWQSRPDDCTALFRYRAGSLMAHAAVLSSVPIAALDTGKGDLALAEVYAALPAGRSALAEFMVGSFRQAFPACQSPRGWQN
ncbi:hypothetical protein [Dyella sp. C11]|uniref:hypothetical protein n=1 Tax=Dyella sp. C11 TaxID=2126991 RepID=UPI000D659EC0|nr:hypothetical protein [Dyella sp. C11]